MLDDLADYRISNLCKAILYIDQKDYESALTCLKERTEKEKADVYVHRSSDANTAAENAYSYCLEKLI